MKLTATSFATRRDLAMFAIAVTNGKTIQQALSVGDNGLGAWGTHTWNPDGPPMCALPKRLQNRHAKFKITIGAPFKSVIASCEDTSPDGIVDLNPAAMLALGFAADDEISIPDVDVQEVS